MSPRFCSSQALKHGPCLLWEGQHHSERDTSPDIQLKEADLAGNKQSSSNYSQDCKLNLLSQELQRLLLFTHLVDLQLEELGSVSGIGIAEAKLPQLEVFGHLLEAPAKPGNIQQRIASQTR